MDEYTLNDLMSGGQAYEDLRASASMDRLVPVIGTGFTEGLRSTCAAVPGSQQLLERLLNILLHRGLIDEADANEVREMDFLRQTDTFFSLADMDGGEVYRHHVGSETAWGLFKSFIQDSFTGVTGLGCHQKDFLAQGWSYLYTLNYDDAIDRELGAAYEKVTPFSRIDGDWLRESKKCLIKLHGDANLFLRSGGRDRLIMTTRQYLDAIGLEANACFINWLSDDFSSKDLLFIGCGLSNELDLLFASTNGVHALGPVSRQGSYYVHFDRSPAEQLPFKLRSRLMSYGIEKVIRVRPEEINTLYELLVEICRESRRATAEDGLSQFSNYSFQRLSSSPADENIDFFLSNQRLISQRDLNRKIVTFPSFAIERDATNLVLRRLNHGAAITVMRGRRFSGKTYVLLQVLESLQRQRRRVLFFTEAVSDELIKKLKEESNCVLLFDVGSISIRQADALRENAMAERGLQIVFMVSSSDRDFIDNCWAQANDTCEPGWIKVDSRLSAGELEAFNNVVGDLLLVNRESRDTFLDYAFYVDGVRRHCGQSILPDFNCLSTEQPNMLVCIIALAICQVVNSTEANVLDIHNELSRLCADNSGLVVQKEYVAGNEGEWYDHSGVKYVANSAYWLSRCLSEYVTSPRQYKDVAQAMCTIAQRKKNQFLGCERDNAGAFYRRMKPYIYYETLQEIFFVGRRGGSITLLETVYEALGPILKDSYQFLHQHAKCALRASRRCQNLEERFDKLSLAVMVLERAIGLAGHRQSCNIKYTLSHLHFTRAIVYTNLIRYCDAADEDVSRWVANAISSFYYFYVSPGIHDEDDCNGREEQNDIAWLVERVLDGDAVLRDLISGCGRGDMFNEVVTFYMRRRIRIDWNNTLG